jgi:hypothetical protein
MVNRTQALVLGFFLVALVSLLVIMVAAPEVYGQALRLPGDRRVAEIAFLAALSGFIAVLGVGVVRRWRWTFWLILVALPATATPAPGGRPEYCCRPAPGCGRRRVDAGRSLRRPLRTAQGRYRSPIWGEDRREVGAAFGIGEGQDLVTGLQDGGTTDRDQLVVANDKADPHVLAHL